MEPGSTMNGITVRRPMPRCNRYVLLLAVLAFLAPASYADYATGMIAYEQERYVEAFEAFRPLGQQGNADAQYRLGLMYEHGRGVDQDATKAAEWYRKAAELEHPQARTNLGSLYYHGRGVERDLAQALRWYQMAADQGRAVAQTNLGSMYESGTGVEANAARAADYYRLAADQGNAEAQYALGGLYAAGNGVKQDDKRAARLIHKAARQEHADAQNKLAGLYAAGRGVKQNATRASEWFRAAAANGNAEAQTNLDSFYASRGTLSSPTPAAADSTGVDKPALTETATAKASSPPSVPAATPEKTPESRSAPATVEPAALGDSHAVKPGGDAEPSTPEALYDRARTYAQGIGVARDEREALRWYQQAAEQGHPMAGYRLALLYLRGRGIEKPDVLQAHLWFSISAELGVGDAADWREKVDRKLTKRQRTESRELLAEHFASDGS